MSEGSLAFNGWEPSTGMAAIVLGPSLYQMLTIKKLRKHEV